MRKLLFLALCLVGIAGATAQNVPGDSIGDYQTRFAKLNKAYAKSPDKVDVLYELAQFYFDNSHPMRNLPMAMKYIQRAEQCHVQLLKEDDNSELTRLVRRDITIATLRQTKQAIADAAYKTIELRTDMTARELDLYMDAFGINMDMVKLIRQRRIGQIYDDDLRKGTVESYHHFMETYPGTREAEEMEARIAQLVPALFEKVNTEMEAETLAQKYHLSPSVQRAAEKKKSSLAYSKVSRLDNIGAYMQYLERFPASDESELAREQMDRLLELSYSRCRTAMDYGRFAITYPDIPLADQAIEEMCRILLEQEDVAATRYYLAHFKEDSHYDEVYAKYFSWHAAEGNAAPLRRFEKENPDYPYRRTLEAELKKAEEVDRVNLMENFLEGEYERYAGYVRHLTGKKIAFVPLQRMIQAQLATRSYAAALDRVRKYDLSFETLCHEEYDELQQILATSNPNRVPSPVFSATYSVKNPSLNEKDGMLYYTRVVGNSYRICYAVKQNEKWLPLGEVNFSYPIINEGLILFGFFADGTRMLLGQNGNIMMAERDFNGWRVTDIPPYPVNTDYYETDAFMLPDGSGMLLASDRPDGYNLQPSGAYFHGDTALATDIYFIPYVNETWGTPVNLGRGINTAYCERSPIMSRNLKTLYFVSDGHGGLGYGDIYMATRSNLQDWTSWSKPKNVGREINSGFAEGDLSFSPDERRVFFSVNSNQGNYTCKSFATWHDGTDAYISAEVDIQGLEEDLMRVRLADLEQQAVIKVTEINDGTTSIPLRLHKDKRYALLGDAGAYFVPALMLVPGQQTKQRMLGYTFPVLVAMDKALPLGAIDFQESNGELTPVAKLQLEQLAKFMARQDHGRVEFCIDVAGRNDEQCYNIAIERGRILRSYMNSLGFENVSISAFGNVNVKKQGRSAVSVRFRD